MSISHRKSDYDGYLQEGISSALRLPVSFSVFHIGESDEVHGNLDNLNSWSEEMIIFMRELFHGEGLTVDYWINSSGGQVKDSIASETMKSHPGKFVIEHGDNRPSLEGFEEMIRNISAKLSQEFKFSVERKEPYGQAYTEREINYIKFTIESPTSTEMLDISTEKYLQQSRYEKRLKAFEENKKVRIEQERVRVEEAEKTKIANEPYLGVLPLESLRAENEGDEDGNDHFIVSYKVKYDEAKNIKPEVLERLRRTIGEDTYLGWITNNNEDTEEGEQPIVDELGRMEGDIISGWDFDDWDADDGDKNIFIFLPGHTALAHMVSHRTADYEDFIASTRTEKARVFFGHHLTDGWWMDPVNTSGGFKVFDFFDKFVSSNDWNMQHFDRETFNADLIEEVRNYTKERSLRGLKDFNPEYIEINRPYDGGQAYGVIEFDMPVAEVTSSLHKKADYEEFIESVNDKHFTLKFQWQDGVLRMDANDLYQGVSDPYSKHIPQHEKDQRQSMNNLLEAISNLYGYLAQGNLIYEKTERSPTLGPIYYHLGEMDKFLKSVDGLVTPGHEIVNTEYRYSNSGTLDAQVEFTLK